MNRLPPLQHPLTALFRGAAQSLTTSLNQDAFRFYYGTIRNFLSFLGSQYPNVQSLQQLRRDPHILAWFASLRSHQPSLATITYTIHLYHLHRMLEELAWTEDLPGLTRLVLRHDTPRAEHYLPRPLTADQDQLIQQELLRRDDRDSNALLLLRHTGMRIGECVDLSTDCLRPLGPDQWAVHVPLGKLKTERWVPVDSFVCELIARIRSLVPAPTQSGRLLLPRSGGRYGFIRRLRATLREAVAAAGITTRIVPHQFRHTYGTEMMNSGVTLAAVMKLLGHKTPHMTLEYLEVTQKDLQREYQLARSQPRHLPPSLALAHTPGSRADLNTLVESLEAVRHVMEMFRREVADESAHRRLARLANRLLKIIAETKKLNPA
jgi:site-specific recombinase XerD